MLQWLLEQTKAVHEFRGEHKEGKGNHQQWQTLEFNRGLFSLTFEKELLESVNCLKSQPLSQGRERGEFRNNEMYISIRTIKSSCVNSTET